MRGSVGSVRTAVKVLRYLRLRRYGVVSTGFSLFRVLFLLSKCTKSGVFTQTHLWYASFLFSSSCADTHARDTQEDHEGKWNSEDSKEVASHEYTRTNGVIFLVCVCVRTM